MYKHANPSQQKTKIYDEVYMKIENRKNPKLKIYQIIQTVRGDKTYFLFLGFKSLVWPKQKETEFLIFSFTRLFDTR